MKLFALSQKHASGDPSTLPAAEALAIARGLRSPVLGGTPLEVGQPADFLLLRGSDPELSAGDLDADLVYAAGGSVVDTTVVAGRVLMRARQVVPGADEIAGEVRARVRSVSPDSVAPVRTQARFPDIPEKAGHYESFYLKLVQPGGGRAAWIRHTVHKRPGEERDLRALVRPLRFLGRRAAGDEAPVRRRRAQRRPGHLHPDRGREPDRWPRDRPVETDGARVPAGT